MTSKPVPAAGWTLPATGILLFLFIPLVLFLFVGHPEPVGWSLAAGVALMLGHRFLARPYMRWALPAQCLWCNRRLAPEDASARLELATGGGVLAARCCPAHREPAARFFRWVDRWRWPLRLGIFVPLLWLLGALAATALGRIVALPAVTSLFRLVVGLTVNVAALGPLLGPQDAASPAPSQPIAVAFPVHNFFLLGVRALLWVFRLIGVWWIVLGVRYFLGR
jgi:hypothetical protein